MLEDIENAVSETAIFHLLNHAKNTNGKLLITSALPPNSIEFALPDLCSRIRALPLAKINEPDENLLSILLHKQFSDRQILVDDELVAYLLPRMERSFASVQEIAENLDSAALSTKRNITIRFAKEQLGW